MKKFSAILVMVLTIFSCFIFSACGGKYSKLKMQFMINGEKVENAVLFIDETNCDEGASVDLQVKFSGIKKKHVGKIDVSSTNKNVEFSNVSYDKMTATFTVTALTSGEIPVKVLHLNSNKSILINLKVEKKSTDVEILNPNYIIQIPEEGVNSHTLKIKDCLALSLSNDLTYGECTDKVYAGLENETVPNGVEVKTTNVDGVDLISGFTVSSEAEAYEFTIYPITTMHSYDKTSFKDKEIKISLVKSEDLNVSLELKNNNQENDENSNVEKYNPLYLIANHTSSKYNTKTIEFNENLLEYYNFTVESSEHILAEKIANNSFTLYSGNKTDETEKVNATFIPKYVGDIETVTKTINVKSEVMPHSINVLKDGKETSADSFEIFDYYANGQGQVFKFVPKEDYSFSSMMGMRIVLNKADLSENNSTSTEVGTNKNLLEFRTSSKGILSFVVNGENVVSDVISKNETVYVKYVESESGNPNSTANITIQSVYTGEEDYLTGINLTSKDLTFEMKKGVAEVEGVYGVVTFMDNIPYHTRIKSLTFENENNEYVSQKLYLKNTDTNYLINLTKLLDQNDQEIDKHTFKVKVLGNGQNNLKLTYNGETKEEFDYLYTKSEKQPADKDNSPYLKTSNSMILDPTSADVGEYKIEIDAGNYLKYVVRVYVCEDIKNAIEIEEGKYDLILNEDVKKIETSWIAENGLDYALASGQTVTFTTKLNNSIISSQLVSGYGYEVSGLDSIDTYISLPNNVDNEDNQVTCSLNEGTCVDGDNKYITLTIKINYFDIDKMEIIKDEIKSAIIEKTIFIYEELKDENISINKTNVNLYSANKVSPYYSNLTTEELKVILNESVKNYGVNYSWYFEGAIIKYNESENRNEFTNTDEVVAIGTPSNEEKLPLAPKNMERATRIIYVTVSQYGVEYTRRVDVRINEPYYTSNLIVTSDLNVDSDANFYIDLKDQESYKIEVDYVDENGQSLEFKDFTGESLNNLEVIVTDQFNNIQIKGVGYTLNDNILTINGLSAGKYKLHLFAKDNLNSVIRTYGQLTYDFREENKDTHKIINLYVTDGTEENPHVINDENDLIWISEHEDESIDEYIKGLNYEIKNDIILHKDITISDFTGAIKSTAGEKFTVSGVNLKDGHTSLFSSFKGTMENVHFMVSFGDLTASGNSVGVFDENTETLTDVTATFSGKTEISDSNSIYIGGLVGTNNGTIEFTESGVEGTIELSGSATVYFGGVAGLNNGTIQGATFNSSTATQETESQETESKVTFVSNSSHGYVASVNITSELTICSIGAVVGRNTNVGSATDGALKNIKVKGLISAESGNIGGIIGENVTTAQTLNVTLDGLNLDSISGVDLINKVLDTARSSVQITGGTNVGGIVGNDNGGAYYYCQYQILNAEQLNGTNVGGLAGISKQGIFYYSSVMSYRWDYNNLASIKGEADITGTNVSGLVGLSTGDGEALKGGDLSKVFIYACSVNAYIKAPNAYALTQGVTSKACHAVITDSYFLGKLNELTYIADNFALNSAYTKVYSVVDDKDNTNTDDAVYSVGLTSVKGGATSPWSYNANYNGGYIYLTTNGNPIFEIAPSKIEAKVDENNLTHGAKNISDTAIHFDYYVFNLEKDLKNYSELYKKLDEKYNYHLMADTYKSDGTVDQYGIFNFFSTPTVINLELRVTSSNTNVVSIVGNQIKVNGVGTAKLTFTSILNSGATCEILVHVSLPVGDINLSTTYGGNSVEADSPITIYENTAQKFHLTTSGKVEEIINSKNEDIYYQTTSEIDLGVNVEADDLSNISISGLKITDGKVTVPYGTVFGISINKHVAGLRYSLSVTPSLTMKIEDVADKVVSFTPINFDVETAVGPNDIQVNFGKAVVYPNDNVIVNAIISTDKKIENDEVLKGCVSIDGFSQGTNYNVLVKTEKFENNKQYVTYTLQLHGILEEEETNKELNVKFSIDENLRNSICLTLLNQRIDKIELKNYESYLGDESKKVTNILKPNRSGMITIEMSPEDAYYDYLEITDITEGNEKIRFVQIDEEGKSLANQDDISSDGEGIKLVKHRNKIYVKTTIDARSTSKNHTILVTAYYKDSKSGEGVFLADQTISVDVKMMPNMVVDYITPDKVTSVGTIDTSQGQKEFEINSVANYIADGVGTILKITTTDTDDLEKSISGGTIESYPELGEDYYILTNDAGSSSVTLNLTAIQHYENKTETKPLNLTFNVVNYVVYSVSINQTMDSAPNVIYGSYDRDIHLEFYFRATDIAYAGNRQHEDIWDKDSLNSSNMGASITAIKSILKTLNNGGYLSYNISKEIKVDIQNNIIKFEAGKAPEKLNLTFGLILDSKNWKIGEGKVSYSKDFKLDLTDKVSPIEYTVIKSEEDFLTMANDETANFILGVDLTLNDFTPIDKHFASFDGNGHTITIESFATSTTTDLVFGLFNTIYEESAVLNLKVVYSGFGRVQYEEVSRAGDYYDFTEKASECTSVKFGGIAVNNLGVISNCETEGRMAVRASKLETYKTAGLTTYNFNVAGLVETNAGHITNSISKMYFYGLANFAGFVHTNNGKIVSNSFEGKIYAYNSTLSSLSIDIKVAGFVLDNKSHISMSHVTLGSSFKGTSSSARTIGNLSAKDISAGFVLENSGTITDSYVSMRVVGDTNNNMFSGFVYENNGTINRVYTNIAGGVRSNSFYMFASPNSNLGTIANSFEIVTNQVGYSNGIEGLTTVVSLTNQDVTKQKGFVYSSNGFEGGVWIMREGVPQLVSCLEHVSLSISYSSAPNVVEGKDKKVTTYYGLRNIIITETTVDVNGYAEVTQTKEVSDNTYGLKRNPIVIYNEDIWNKYFNSGEKISTDYYRIVNDIDLSGYYSNLKSSEAVFSGNIQGNNMSVTGIRLNYDDARESVGLFKEMKRMNNYFSFAVRNLTVSAIRVSASRTKTVGVLAGIIDGYALYNITVDSPELVVSGANAVGGVAGVIKGNIDLALISSNVSATSTRTVSDGQYNIYLSQATGKSANVKDVYYAGAVAGIIDGYKNSSRRFDVAGVTINESDIKNYSLAYNISVNGSVLVTGDSAGAVFGFVGERTKIENVNVTLNNATVKGYRYSAVVAGENRGVIQHATIQVNGDVFKLSEYGMAGVVGLNLGGLIDNADVTVDIINEGYTSVVGGFVARNVDGYITNSTFNGKLKGYYTGGVIAQDFSCQKFKEMRTGNGAIKDASLGAVPSSVIYTGLEKVKNVTLSKETLDYWKENLSEFYTFFKEKPVEGKEYEDAELKNQITLYRALGLMIASSNSEFSIESSWTETVDSEDVTVKGIKLELKNNNLILNGTGKTKFEDISSNYKLDLSQNSESDQISLIKEIKDSENVYINVCGGGNKLFFIIGNDAPNSWDQKSITDTVILF